LQGVSTDAEDRELGRFRRRDADQADLPSVVEVVPRRRLPRTFTARAATSRTAPTEMRDSALY
jgi:hypothetical protein